MARSLPATAPKTHHMAGRLQRFGCCNLRDACYKTSKDLIVQVLKRFQQKICYFDPKLASSESGGISVAPTSKYYYPQQASCQILSLNYLLGKFLGEREFGYYVEVGAFDGVFASNTWGLAERGWHGLLLEPVPELAEACRTFYAKHERVKVDQVAVGDAEKTIKIHYAGTLTTASDEVFREYHSVDWAKNSLTAQKAFVPCRRLDQVLVAHSVPLGFDLLVVDVEGFEWEVFQGFGLERWLPKMIIVELSDTHPDLVATEVSDAVLGREILTAGYVIVYKDAVNTVFVRDEVWYAAFQLAQ